MTAMPMRERLARYHENSDRMYARNFFDREWIATLMADADTLIDALEERLTAEDQELAT